MIIQSIQESMNEIKKTGCDTTGIDTILDIKMELMKQLTDTILEYVVEVAPSKAETPYTDLLIDRIYKKAEVLKALNDSEIEELAG